MHATLQGVQCEKPNVKFKVSAKEFQPLFSQDTRLQVKCCRIRLSDRNRLAVAL
jgi:hypothetical protein